MEVRLIPYLGIILSFNIFFIMSHSSKIGNNLVCPPKKLNKRHFVLLRELMSGTPLTKAAKLCGYSYGRAGVIVASIPFKEAALAFANSINNKFISKQAAISYVDDARALLVEESVKAAKTLVGSMDSGDGRVALDASKDVLDRVGLTKPREATTVQTNLLVSDNLAFALQIKVEK